ncbi:MAG: hypothetical protein VXW17_02480, partial [Pseudomonadota bacterium]|nr:hypothetical protein [Pseudomonadota bacterium]
MPVERADCQSLAKDAVLDQSSSVAAAAAAVAVPRSPEARVEPPVLVAAVAGPEVPVARPAEEDTEDRVVRVARRLVMPT